MPNGWYSSGLAVTKGRRAGFLALFIFILMFCFLYYMFLGIFSLLYNLKVHELCDMYILTKIDIAYVS